jgi:hypothetical protein
MFAIRVGWVEVVCAVYAAALKPDGRILSASRKVPNKSGIKDRNPSENRPLHQRLAALYERQRMESLRLYNNTARPKWGIDHDMTVLDVVHQKERDHYIRDYQKADDLRRELADKQQARAQDQDHKFTRQGACAIC